MALRWLPTSPPASSVPGKRTFAARRHRPGRPFFRLTKLAEATIHVLLADDDEVFLESLRTLIEEQRGFSVVGTASDGLAAIELVDELDPHAAVIDLHMPLLDGVSAVARMRRDHPNLCLIALTGDEAPALHAAVKESGADEVLLKGELIDTLVERLIATQGQRQNRG
jgi:DNA-binding NarL/FixJ family response regulator